MPIDSAEMEPRVRRGAWVQFASHLVDDAMPGDGVLVRDSTGGMHFRVYKAGKPGAWEAHAANVNFEPLFSDRDSYTLGWKRPNRPRRLRLFADAYGLIPRDRQWLVRTIRKRIVDHVEGIRRMAAAGDPAFVRIVHKGHLRRPMRDLRLLDYERHTLEYALR